MRLAPANLVRGRVPSLAYKTVPHAGATNRRE